jgi:hypothetical protein
VWRHGRRRRRRRRLWHRSDHRLDIGSCRLRRPRALRHPPSRGAGIHGPRCHRPTRNWRCCLRRHRPRGRGSHRSLQLPPQVSMLSGGKEVARGPRTRHGVGVSFGVGFGVGSGVGSVVELVCPETATDKDITESISTSNSKQHNKQPQQRSTTTEAYLKHPSLSCPLLPLRVLASWGHRRCYPTAATAATSVATRGERSI